MNKKTLITLIVVAAIFLLGIAAGVIYLYKGDTGKRTSPAAGKVNVNVQFPLLRAVPSDAAQSAPPVDCNQNLKLTS